MVGPPTYPAPRQQIFGFSGYDCTMAALREVAAGVRSWHAGSVAMVETAGVGAAPAFTLTSAVS
eukprot:2133900-Pleurochrysis_carterae.AAC.1